MTIMKLFKYSGGVCGVDFVASSDSGFVILCVLLWSRLSFFQSLLCVNADVCSHPVTVIFLITLLLITDM